MSTDPYRPLFVFADRQALDQAAIDRWFGPPPSDMDSVTQWYRMRRLARDASFGMMMSWSDSHA